MSNRDYLDEFVVRQTDPLKGRLVRQFRDLCGDINIPSSEYPAQLRQVLDDLFRELTTNAASRTDDP